MCFNILQNKIYKMFTFHPDQYFLILLLDPALCRIESLLHFWVRISQLWKTLFSFLELGDPLSYLCLVLIYQHAVRLLVSLFVIILLFKFNLSISSFLRNIKDRGLTTRSEGGKEKNVSPASCPLHRRAGAL